MNTLALIIADVLSIITIALCLILKLPQIIRLIKAGSARGISIYGLLLELSSYTVMMLYNYMNGHALLSYMEYPIIIIQEYIIIILVMHYMEFKITTVVSIFAVYFLIFFAFVTEIVDKIVLLVLVPFTTPVGAASKVMQLLEICRKRNADSVSVLTWFLSVFTNVTRIYTVYVDSADMALLMNFSVSSLLSGSVMLAAIYYQNITKSRKYNIEEHNEKKE